MKNHLFYHRITKLLLVCFLFATCSSNNNSTPEPDPPTPPVADGDVKILTTTTDLSQDLSWQAVDFSTTSNMSPTTITLNPAERYQTMDGFGAAITGSTSYNLMQM